LSERSVPGLLVGPRGGPFSSDLLAWAQPEGGRVLAQLRPEMILLVVARAEQDTLVVAGGAVGWVFSPALEALA